VMWRERQGKAPGVEGGVGLGSAWAVGRRSWTVIGGLATTGRTRAKLTGLAGEWNPRKSRVGGGFRRFGHTWGSAIGSGLATARRPVVLEAGLMLRWLSGGRAVEDSTVHEVRLMLRRFPAAVKNGSLSASRNAPVEGVVSEAFAGTAP